MGPASVKASAWLAGAMRLPFVGDVLDDVPEEWREVPVYSGLKALAGGWVEEGFNVVTEGLEHVPGEGGAVVAANHASFFDPVFLGSMVDRPIRWMAKAELFRHPVSSFFFGRAGQIKVDRVSGGNQEAVDRCVELVAEDRLVGIFPEGGRSIDGSLRRGKTGVARVAMRTGAPVIPVALNSYDVLPKHARVPALDDPLVIMFGEPLSFSGEGKRVGDREACREVTDAVMGEIARLLERARTRREALAMNDEG